MAWKKKTLAILCFLVFVSVLFLQEFTFISTRLPSRDQKHRRVTDKPYVVIDDKGGNQERGSYTVIKNAPGKETFKTKKNVDVGIQYQDFDFPTYKKILKEDNIFQQIPFMHNDSSDRHIELFNYDKVVTEHARRIENLKRACQDALKYRKEEHRKGNLSEFFYSREHTFAYCKVPKSGSTFWMNLFTILIKGDQYSKQISRMSRAEIHARGQLFVTNPSKILHNNIPTVIVSRNPFSRLFSAYVDKVYIPLFWEQFRYMENVSVLDTIFKNATVEVLKSSNKPLSNRLSKYKDMFREKGLLIKKNITQVITPICANNATFESFLRFIISEIESGRSLEPHWAPVSHLCHPCKFNMYKIVKQESFSVDVEHTLQSVGVNISKHEWLKRSLNENRAENSVPGIIAVIQAKYKHAQTKACMTQVEISKRVWKSFQIQGFISKEIQFPDTLLDDRWETGSKKLTGEVLRAISQKVMTSSERSRQREYYLKQAYSNIPADVISSIQDIYYLDFELFDYSIIPP